MPEIHRSDKRQGLHPSLFSRARVDSIENSPADCRETDGKCESQANPLTEENQRLRKENARLSRRLEQAELIIDVQKKVSALLGISLPEVKSGEENS
jgi:transposase